MKDKIEVGEYVRTKARIYRYCKKNSTSNAR